MAGGVPVIRAAHLDGVWRQAENTLALPLKLFDMQ
jgi:hypothetical protein